MNINQQIISQFRQPHGLFGQIAGLICTWAMSSLLQAEPVWIDTDPACGISRTSDVDDCWALHLALRSPELEIRGISTVMTLSKDSRQSY